DEVIGTSGSEFWGDEAKAITGFKKILRSGDFKGELLAVRENGTKMFLDTKANLIKDENNKPIGIVGTFTDVTKHLKTEQKLKKNKQILQKKLNQILSPDYEVCEEDFGNIVDIEQLQNIMDDFYKLTNIGVAIENIKGDVLVATGWQDICTEFHRVHPETRKKCIESDIYLSENAKPGEYLAYKCKNNMWDIATPIMIGNKKIGNLLLGQFFYDDEEIDYNFFIEQAKKFGFDVGEYIAALERVPRWSRERVKKVMDFYSKFAEMLSDLSYSNLKLAHLLQEKKKIGQKLIKERNNSDFYKELLAHDMGNILNNLKSALALMEMYKTSQDKVKNSEEIMEIFENQVNRGTSLIKNVRRLSEIEKQEQKIKDINVIPIIQKSIEDIPKISQGKEICIQTKIPDQRLMVRGGELLMDAFDNILNNGIKHNNKEQVKLWVEISKIQKNQEKFVRIEFKDNGIGISDQRKKYIFQKDFKKAKRKGGMGIGLSLVRRIIEGYRGEISVHNLVEGESDKGSNFIVLLKKSTSSN
ncbi:MAG: PocR ligand-binding domain-containing protein, partial [Promethearchaeia archaeon]